MTSATVELVELPFCLFGREVLKYAVVECIIRSMSYNTMIIDREVSTDIMLILIVTFD